MVDTMVIRIRTNSPTRAEEIASYRRQKVEQIHACLDKRNVDLWQLRELALTRGGLINAEVRSKAWHKLAGINPASAQDSSGYQSDIDLIEADEVELIRRDVGRSVLFRYYDYQQQQQLSQQCDDSSPRDVSAGSIIDATQAMSLTEDFGKTPKVSSDQSDATASTCKRSHEWEQQNKLASLITSSIAPRRCGGADSIIIIDEDEKLHYYQGFHDVASVILLNISDDHVASSILRTIAQGPLRDATKSSFTQITALLGMAFFPLVRVFDEGMHDFLAHCDCSTDVVLPWVITWFAHDVHDGEMASRLFDAFLASHPLMPLYLAVAIVVHPISRKRIFTTECDAGMIQMALAELLKGISSDWDETGSRDTLTFQTLIDDAISFMRKVQPSSLPTLCRRYSREAAASIIKRSSQISMLKPPPSWALASTAPADWVQWQQKQTRGGGCRGKIGTSGMATASLKSVHVHLSPVSNVLTDTGQSTCARAKAASGASSLIDSESDQKTSGGRFSAFAFNNGTLPSGAPAAGMVVSMIGKIVQSASAAAAKGEMTRMGMK